MSVTWGSMNTGNLITDLQKQVMEAERKYTVRMSRICVHCREPFSEHSNIGARCPNRAYRVQNLEPVAWGDLYLLTTFEQLMCISEFDDGDHRGKKCGRPAVQICHGCGREMCEDCAKFACC